MSDISLAEQRNEDGNRLRDAGDIAGAEAAYRAAMAADPEWSAPAYNLGLLFKYMGRWAESFELNLRATELAPDDEAGWWNLGIAATALARWRVARRAWTACGMTLPPGDGPPDFGWGMTPVRLDPDSEGEVVWARRIDPARAEIVSIPLPTARFHWKDVVLTDGAMAGERVVGEKRYPVFDVLQKLVPSAFRTYVIELATADPDALEALEQCATDRGGAAENWGRSTHILCRACSLGVPHEHSEGDSPPAHPHCGLAARDHAHADEIITAWLTHTPRADLTSWYEAEGSS